MSVARECAGMRRRGTVLLQKEMCNFRSVTCSLGRRRDQPYYVPQLDYLVEHGAPFSGVIRAPSGMARCVGTLPVPNALNVRAVRREFLDSVGQRIRALPHSYWRARAPHLQ